MNEHELIRAQVDWVNEKFGPGKPVNYGWGVGEEGVASKIYGEDGGILDSFFDGGEIVHEFVPFKR